jgi:hypothetical protein
MEGDAAGVWLGGDVPSVLHGVGRGGRIRTDVEGDAQVLRPQEAARLDVELARRRDHQGAKRGAHTGPNPTERAKSGRKRHLVTDARGVPNGLTISAANVPDLRLALSTIDSIGTVAPRRRFRPTHCCMDKGYDDRAIRIGFQLRNIHAHIRRRGEPPLLGSYKGKARRWVVERTNSWHNRFRALLVSWERKDDHYEALCHLANAIIAYRIAIS